MTGRRALVGLSLLCALAFTAFSAASASAATTTEGTTAVTCVEDPTHHGDFKDAHCDETETETGAFKHVPITETTEVTGTNEKTASSTTKSTPAILGATVGGITVGLEAQKVDSLCSLTNSSTGEKPAKDSWTLSECIVTYTEVTVTTPANCTVMSPGSPDGTVVTSKLMGTLVGNGTSSMSVKFEPEPVGGVTPPFTTLKFTGTLCPINGVEAKVTGDASATLSGQSEMVNKAGHLTRSSGATLNINVTKAEKTLIVGGQPAAFTAKETTKMVGGNPIGTTEENF
jgi:hypothetical protein